MSTPDTLTPEERNAIAALERIAAKWPRSLWLFAAGTGGNGTLHVMRHGNMTAGGAFDPKDCMATIAIPCDGGDW